MQSRTWFCVPVSSPRNGYSLTSAGSGGVGGAGFAQGSTALLSAASKGNRHHQSIAVPPLPALASCEENKSSLIRSEPLTPTSETGRSKGSGRGKRGIIDPSCGTSSSALVTRVLGKVSTVTLYVVISDPRPEGISLLALCCARCSFISYFILYVKGDLLSHSRHE